MVAEVRGRLDPLPVRSRELAMAKLISRSYVLLQHDRVDKALGRQYLAPTFAGLINDRSSESVMDVTVSTAGSGVSSAAR